MIVRCFRTLFQVPRPVVLRTATHGSVNAGEGVLLYRIFQTNLVTYGKKESEPENEPESEPERRVRAVRN